jgi:hypothetical protein
MRSKRKQTTLHVKAVHPVRYIDTDTGEIVKDMSFVGLDADLEIIPEGVTVGYHSYYIQEIKNKSLLAMDVETAKLAGVPFVG